MKPARLDDGGARRARVNRAASPVVCLVVASAVGCATAGRGGATEAPAQCPVPGRLAAAGRVAGGAILESVAESRARAALLPAIERMASTIVALEPDEEGEAEKLSVAIATQLVFRVRVLERAHDAGARVASAIVVLEPEDLGAVADGIEGIGRGARTVLLDRARLAYAAAVAERCGARAGSAM